jgi:hypothetical protein
MPTIRIHCRQEDGEVVTYTPTSEKDCRDSVDLMAFTTAQEQGETVTIGCVIAEYVREEMTEGEAMKEYEVEVLHTKVWKTVETVRAESEEEAVEQVESRHETTDREGNMVRYSAEAYPPEEVAS